jgi:hypothetical protein
MEKIAIPLDWIKSPPSSSGHVLVTRDFLEEQRIHPVKDERKIQVSGIFFNVGARSCSPLISY